MPANEALGMLLVGGAEDCLPLLVCLVSEAKVQGSRGEQADAGMAMFVVVPREEPLAEGTGVLDRPETVRKLGAVLHGAELAFRERIVVGDMRA